MGVLFTWKPSKINTCRDFDIAKIDRIPTVPDRIPTSVTVTVL